MSPQAHPGILRIARYDASVPTLPGFPAPVLLSANESCLGPSPKAVAAARAALERCHLYPDAGTGALNEALAKKHGISAEGILCGTGSEALIEVLCRVFAGPGAEVLMPQFSFPMFAVYANAVGATVVTAPAKDFTVDVDALLARVTPATKLLFVANPNNPTGTWVARDTLERLVAALPEHVMVVLDSAYAEFLVGEAGYDDGLRFVAQYPERVVVLRTFSKLYALAGLRVGWLYAAPPIIDLLLRARFVFPVTSPSQAAAVAALGDEAHVQASLAHNARWRTFLSEGLTAAGIEVLPSGGNFVFARFPGRWQAADAALRARGIIVRAIGGMEGLRISVGREGDMRAVVDALTAWRRNG